MLEKCDLEILRFEFEYRAITYPSMLSNIQSSIHNVESEISLERLYGRTRTERVLVKLLR